MADEGLPTDLSQWPIDPYRLLNVDRDADEKTIKRAYVRLIRQYKPEHQPEQFQRIRQAYELISGSGGGVPPAISHIVFQPGRSGPLDVSRDESTDPAVSNRGTLDARRRRGEGQRPGPSLSSVVLSVLPLIGEGTDEDLRQAINRLEAGGWAEPDRRAAWLASYWLAKCSGEEEAQERAARRLLSGLHLFAVDDNVKELAVWELRRHPQLAALLEPRSADDSVALWMYLRRWSAALRLRSLAGVLPEVQEIKRRWLDQPPLLCFALSRLVGHLLWSPEQQHQELCRTLTTELDNLYGTEQHLGQTLDDLQEAARLSVAWRKSPPEDGLAAEMHAAVPFIWSEDVEASGGVIERFVETAATDWQAALTAVDRLLADPTMRRFWAENLPSVVLRWLGDATGRQRFDGLVVSADSELTNYERFLVFRFLASRKLSRYGQWRAAFGEFCAEHCIAWHKLLKMIGPDLGNHSSSVIKAVQSFEELIGPELRKDESSRLLVDVMIVAMRA